LRHNNATHTLGWITSLISIRTCISVRSKVADSRFGNGPSSENISQLRFGLYGHPLASAIASGESPTPLGPAAAGNETVGPGGAQIGPLGLTGGTDGMMRFGFSTSLRDIMRFGAEEEARKGPEAGLRPSRRRFGTRRTGS